MDSYYQILGIEQNAEEGEIKRAYFKAIRRYPPDKAPEQFKEFREAYEVLMDRERRELYDSTMEMDPALLDTYKEAIYHIDMEEYEEALECCESVLRRSDEEIFELLLGEIYLLNGNSGKSIKKFEMLCKRHPEKRSYKKWLAVAYRERSWSKKAATVLGELEEECRGKADFLLLQGSIFYGLQLFEKAVEKFSAAGKAFQSEEGWDIQLSEGLWRLLAGHLNEMPGAAVGDVLNAYGAYAGAYGRKKKMLANSLPAMLHSLEQYGAHEEVDITGLDYVFELAGEWKKSGALTGEKKMRLAAAESKLEQLKLNRDKRIGETIRAGSELLYGYSLMKETMEEAQDELHQIEIEYMAMQLKEEVEPLIAQLRVCIIQELPGIRKEMAAIKESYPRLAEAFGGFIDEVIKNNSRAFLLNKYEKKIKRPFVDRMSEMLDLYGDDYDDDYDDGDMDYGWAETVKPYRRETPKIGRNDPCPCGSGKKYKNCCGKS